MENPHPTCSETVCEDG